MVKIYGTLIVINLYINCYITMHNAGNDHRQEHKATLTNRGAALAACLLPAGSSLGDSIAGQFSCAPT
jgi:hypothetical protein